LLLIAQLLDELILTEFSTFVNPKVSKTVLFICHDCEESYCDNVSRPNKNYCKR